MQVSLTVHCALDEGRWGIGRASRVIGSPEAQRMGRKNHTRKSGSG